MCNCFVGYSDCGFQSHTLYTWLPRGRLIYMKGPLLLWTFEKFFKIFFLVKTMDVYMYIYFHNVYIFMYKSLSLH